MMKRALVLIVLALLPCTFVFADMDVELEKREAAKREAAKQVEAAKQREMQQMKSDAAAKANAEMNKHLTDAQRKALGMPPAGSPTPK
jgi:hypothetical protein